MINSPCKNCENRHLGCHGECNKYITFKRKYAIEKSIIRKKKYEEHLFYANKY